MGALADAERFEEAALARDRLRAIAEALVRRRADGWLLTSGELVLRDDAGRRFRLRGGALVRDGDTAGEDGLGEPCPKERADELAVLRSWIARNPPVVEATDRPLAEPVDGGADLHRVLATLRGASRRTADGADGEGAERRVGTN
jgi:hypothetical protein